MKKIIAVLSTLAISFFGANSALAAPFNAVNNPQIVANFQDNSLHGIPGESETHRGSDVVMRAGDSGNFQQWFYGTSTENGGITEGDHSIWKSVGDSTTCKDNQVLVPDASSAWGDYLQPGNYCVRTNDFHSSEQHTP